MEVIKVVLYGCTVAYLVFMVFLGIQSILSKLVKRDYKHLTYYIMQTVLILTAVLIVIGKF